MENKTSYTFDNAISEADKRYGLNNWSFSQAAELYKEKATEELRKELDLAKSVLGEERLNNPMNKIAAELLKERDNAIAEIERLTQSNKELVEAFGLHEAYPLTDIINNLIEATDRLLGYYSYDGQRYEELQLCSKLAKEAVIKIKTIQKSKP